MKAALLLAITVFISNAHANCVGNSSDADLISGFLNKVNIFGTWKGTSADGDNIVAKFTTKSNGAYSAELTFGDSHYGPTGVKFCDNGGSYSGIVYGYEAAITVISKNKITVASPFDDNESYTVTRQ